MLFTKGDYMITEAVAFSSPVNAVYARNARDYDDPTPFPFDDQERLGFSYESSSHKPQFHLTMEKKLHRKSQIQTINPVVHEQHSEVHGDWTLRFH